MPNKRNSAVGPIGMFDSGFGGLTVARAVIDLLPHEDVVYIGDTGRYPYGNKPAEQVREYAKELAWSLVNDYNAKLVVIACNTAASVALHELAAELPVPVLGVVEPGARALVRATQNGKVGVIGTVGTISSGAYVNAIRDTKAHVALNFGSMPRVRRICGARSDHRRRSDGVGRTLAGTSARCRRRCVVTRLHALSVFIARH